MRSRSSTLGDGALTKKIADPGCNVVAVDSSGPQVEAAKRLGLEAYVMNGEELPFREEFDAVFSNAALHWKKDGDAMIGGVYRCLRRGGRFVAECGGYGCVNKIPLLWFKPLSAEGLMASRAYFGIFQLPETTQHAWNAPDFA